MKKHPCMERNSFPITISMSNLWPSSRKKAGSPGTKSLRGNYYSLKQKDLSLLGTEKSFC